MFFVDLCNGLSHRPTKWCHHISNLIIINFAMPRFGLLNKKNEELGKITGVKTEEVEINCEDSLLK